MIVAHHTGLAVLIGTCSDAHPAAPLFLVPAPVRPDFRLEIKAIAAADT
jgi:hypothetical protein